jgi:putative addiction module component (TIGR02574 family)
MARITVDQLLDMPSAERVELAQALWDSVAQNPDNVPLTEDQRQELDRRLKAYDQDRTSGATWESIKSSLRGE